MRIAKLTLDGYDNYGNTLQNFALQEYLKMYADQVDTLWYTPEELIGEYWTWGWKEKIKNLIDYKGFRGGIKKGYRAWELARRARFLDFQQRYINIRYDIDQLEDVAEEYDYFVVGSDQVWNPGNKKLETAFLGFAPSDKRISFAASIGAQSISDEKKEQYIQGFRGMKAISVRETRAAEIISELTEIEATVVLDPVFCVSENRWREISVRPYWLKESAYIFTYFLGAIPEQVEAFAKEKGLELINCFDKSRIECCIMSPEEWLYLLGNAEYVITDSFHASAFSIIFGRDFFVYNRREDERRKQMITRLISLLDTFDMNDRLIDDKNGFVAVPVDAAKTKAIIGKELEKSNAFLKKAFS